MTSYTEHIDSYYKTVELQVKVCIASHNYKSTTILKIVIYISYVSCTAYKTYTHDIKLFKYIIHVTCIP